METLLDDIKASLDNYRDTRRRKASRSKPLPADAWDYWILANICEVAEGLLPHPHFQRLVRWPIEAFKDPESPESGAVASFTQSAKNLATELHKILRANAHLADIANLKPKFDRQLVDVFPFDKAAIKQAKTNAKGLPTVGVKLGLVSALMASDYVHGDDYFCPRFGKEHCTEDRSGSPLLEFSETGPVSVLALTGDFVTDAMHYRCSTVFKTLKAILRQMVNSGALESLDSPAKSRLERRWKRFGQDFANIVRIRTTGEDARLRRACITCFQMILLYCEGHDIDWFPMEAAAMEQGLNRLRARLANADSLAQREGPVIKALGDLRVLAADERFTVSPKITAIAQGKLVIDMAERVAYWRYQRIDLSK